MKTSVSISNLRRLLHNRYILSDDAMNEFIRIREEVENLESKILNVGIVNEANRVCDCTHTQACKLCAESKGIRWDDEWDE
jgi:hypothetical protein